MDALLQASILGDSGGSLRLPTRIRKVKVDPRMQPSAPGDGGRPVEVGCHVHSSLGVVVCGGVEIHGLHATVAPRRSLQSPATLEEYCFVPYTQDVDESDSALQAYTFGCLNYTLECMKRLLDMDINGLLLNKEILQEVVDEFKTSERKTDLQSLKSSCNSGLVHTLEKLFSLSVSKILPEDASNILQSFRNELSSDVLLSNLSRDSVLKPCIDIVLENVSTNKVSIFEAGAASSCLYRKIVPFVTTHPLKHVNYIAADKASLDKDAKTFGVKHSQWDLSTAKSVPPGKVQLLVLKNILHKQTDVDQSLTLLSEMLSTGGFLLVEEITHNFPIFLAIEALSEKLPQLSKPVVGHLFGCYLSESSWIEVFTRHNFEIIYKRSDKLLSTMFLLKKKPDVLSQSLVFINDLEYSWLEDVKTKLRALESDQDNARVWVVATEHVSGLAGFITCLRTEAGGSKVRGILLSQLDDTGETPAISLDSDTFKELSQKDLVANVFRGGVWGSLRHLGLPSPASPATGTRSEFAYVDVTTRGDLASLRWIESPLKFHSQPPGDNGEMCNVYYTSLNFRDVMLATGKLPPDALPGNQAAQDCILGMEFSGRDSRGAKVMGILPAKGLATSVLTSPNFLWPIPPSWTMQQAASVPVVYCTAYYALVVRGRIRAGERVLVHSGSGGVGQAAIAVALSYGCEVFTTVGSPEKKRFLQKTFPQLNERHFSNSRDLSFEYHILKETKGKGVDVVLNSLAEDKLQASVRLLARHGRFLEIGKFDLARDAGLGMGVFLRNVSFCGILLDALFEDEGEDWHQVSGLVTEGMASGVVRPLNTTVFDKEQVEDAFRYMAQGRHVGKVLIQVRSEETDPCAVAPPVHIPCLSRSICHHSKVYIIIGGLGGFGLELANWLVNRGARKLVLTSRSGVKTGYQYRKIQGFKDLGVRVDISKKDCKTLEAAKSLLKDSQVLGPIGGLFNLAMVLQDGLLENQTPLMFRRCCEPKVKGTINLDLATRELCPYLDWFVVFSSVVSGRGNLGQTNYGFANSLMERVCERRHADKLPGMAIQWGAVGDVGVVADSMGGNDTVVGGTLPQRIVSCLAALDTFLCTGKPVVSSFVLAAQQTDKRDEATKVNLVDAVARILGVKDASTIDPDASLADLGLDSLMGVEVKQLLERDHELVLSSKEIRLLNIKKLNDLGGTCDEGPGDSPAPGPFVNGGPQAEHNNSQTPAAVVRFNYDQLMPKERVVRINEGSAGLKPFFIVHPIEGNVLPLAALAALLPCPVYGLQVTRDAPLSDVTHLAGFYLQTIHSVCKGSSYRLGGYSYGAMVALEMAMNLHKQVETSHIGPLVLLDGSHKFVEQHISIYRKLMNIKNKTEEEAATMIGFVWLFTKDIDTQELFRRLVAAPSPALRRQAAVDAVLTAGLSASRASRADLEALALAYKSILLIGEAYRPGVYPGDVTFISSEGSRGTDFDLKSVCSGTITTHEVPGSHETFIIGKEAENVAAILGPLLS